VADREVTIKISAKNLTTAEFKKVRTGLAGIGSSAKGATTKASGLQRAFSSFGRAAPGALKAVTIGAAAVTGAVAGVAAGIVALGQKGAMISDVKSAFDSLSASAGSTGAIMLGALSAGVKGTITNFELMKMANTALGAGLLDSAGDARTMAEGARLLAKRTGTDTAGAFNTLTTAMASGRTAQLKTLGLFVDNKKACEDYAKAQGRTYSSLTDVDRAAALQAATLAALRQELASNAPPLADFGELIEQGKVAVKNLVDGLALMISKSPPLIAGMQAVRDIVGEAFGGDQSGLILTIVNMIERAALIAIEFGKAGISAAGFIYRAFSGIKLIVMGVAIAITELQKRQADSVASTLELAATIPGLGGAFEGAATLARSTATALEGVNTGLKAQIGDTLAAAAGVDAFGQGLTTATGVLDTIKERMVDAGTSQREFNTDVGTTTTAIATLATESEGSSTRIKTACEDWGKKFRKELSDTKTKTETWAGEEKAFLQDLAKGESGGSFMKLGLEVVGFGDVVAIQTQEMQSAFETFGLQTRAQSEASLKKLKADFKKIEKSGKATPKQLTKAWEIYEKKRQEFSGITETFTMTSNQAILTGTTNLLQQLGTKSKAAAYASAVIGTAQAVVQALRSSPPPGSWILAAINAAMGAVQIAAISSQKAYQMGTAGLDYQEFGTASPAMLHGKEAVIPQGSGHQLAQEIAGAMDRGQRPDAQLAELREIRSSLAELRGLPRSIGRAVRDGVLLAS